MSRQSRHFRPQRQCIHTVCQESNVTCSPNPFKGRTDAGRLQSDATVNEEQTSVEKELLPQEELGQVFFIG